MLIEKSFDYQRSWNVTRYYAKNCAASFPGVPVAPQPDITSPYCSSDYSDIEPSSGGEVSTAFNVSHQLHGAQRAHNTAKK